MLMDALAVLLIVLKFDFENNDVITKFHFYIERSMEKILEEQTLSKMSH